VHKTILKSRKWLTMNYVMNITGGSIRLGFYIFRGEKIRGDYIMHYKPITCMVV
jgi:hypothetical protein